jgi:hypothetical protein
MTAREWVTSKTSEFIWSIFVLVLVAAVVWCFGSFFLSLAAFLLIILAAMLPVFCLLLPIWLVYLLVRALVEAIRK